jgi:DNA-binding NarL/FixJ family response regulator
VSRAVQGSEGQKKIRVMFADDHPMLRAGLAVTVESEDDMQVVGEAGSGAEAIEMWKRLRPDVVLMDLRMPGVNGLDAIRQIREMDPSAKLIVLTTYDGDEDIYRALTAGARGYLLKDMLRRELADAIRAVQAGQRYMSPSVAARLAERSPSQELSARESEILTCLVRGLSNKEIASELGVAEGTVRIHLSNIFEKMGVHDRTHAAILAVQRGFVHLD